MSQNKDYYTGKDYMENPSLFIPCWKDEWNPPEKLTNFEKKWETFFNPQGRLMCMAHRSDNDIFYPEDSLEGIMSCIAAGVDFLELDIRTTKDGVHVLMHDPTVTRTTNVNELRAAGVEEIPETDELAEWTFEQLRKLRLVLERPAGNILTNYVIPTFEDMVMVCANKIFVFLDIKSPVFTWDEDAYPIIKKYNAYRSIWLPCTFSTRRPMEYNMGWLNKIQEESGYRAAFQVLVHPGNVADSVRLIQEYNLPLCLRGGDYKPEADEAYAPYFSDYRIHVNGIWKPYNTLDVWKSFHETGYKIIQVDDYMTLLKYIAEQL